MGIKQESVQVKEKNSNGKGSKNSIAKHAEKDKWRKNAGMAS